MRRLPVFLLIGLLLIVIASPFVGLAYEDDIVADYQVVACDLIDEAVIQRKTTGHVVGAMVFAYGWNDHFIIAKQHPVHDWPPKVDTGTTHWFIIEVGSGKVHGPLTEEEFLKLRETLSVPADLTFTKYVGARKG